MSHLHIEFQKIRMTGDETDSQEFQEAAILSSAILHALRGSTP